MASNTSVAEEASARPRDAGAEEISTLKAEGTKSWVDQAGDLVDNNLRIFRTLPWILGGLGAILIYRNSYLFMRFRGAASIPAKLISSNACLYGKVAACDWNSVYVWHIPMAFRWLRIVARPPSDRAGLEHLVRVTFAGVAITMPEQSRMWLETRMNQRPVWFSLLQENREQNSVHCLVHSKSGWFQRRYSINTALVSAGLGAIVDVKGLHNNTKYLAFVKELNQNEGMAKKKGRGMWVGTEYESWWRRLRRRITG